MAPTESDLTKALVKAIRLAVTDLLKQNKGHHFYYCSLITYGGAQSPFLSAWSEEALEAELASRKTPIEESSDIAWSYSDSPFCFFGEDHFNEVEQLWSRRPEIDNLADKARAAECELRFRAMEAAMAQLDREGLFGQGEARNSIVINAEVMPADHTNTERAIRLNPPEALTQWLVEVAEPRLE